MSGWAEYCWRIYKDAHALFDTLCPFLGGLALCPQENLKLYMYNYVSNRNVIIECSIEKGVIEASMTIMEDNTFV